MGTRGYCRGGRGLAWPWECAGSVPWEERWLWLSGGEEVALGAGWCMWMSNGGTYRRGCALVALPSSGPATSLGVTFSVGPFGSQPGWENDFFIYTNYSSAESGWLHSSGFTPGLELRGRSSPSRDPGELPVSLASPSLVGWLDQQLLGGKIIFVGMVGKGMAASSRCLLPSWAGGNRRILCLAPERWQQALQVGTWGRGQCPGP